MTAFPPFTSAQTPIHGGAVATRRPRPVTLIARAPGLPLEVDTAGSRVVAIDAVALLLRASTDGLIRVEVERVILDRLSDGELADLMAALPHKFRGDVLHLTGDHTALLSTSRPAGGRVTRSLTRAEAEHYLRTCGLADDARRMSRLSATAGN